MTRLPAPAEFQPPPAAGTPGRARPLSLAAALRPNEGLGGTPWLKGTPRLEGTPLERVTRAVPEIHPAGRSEVKGFIHEKVIPEAVPIDKLC